jgi:hypothetical protein
MHGFGTLALTPFGSWERPVVLASSIVAMRLRREEGWQEAPIRDALWHFDGMSRLASARLRDFVSQARLSSFPLNRVRDEELADIVRRAISDGRVIALRQGDAVAGPSATTEQRRLISAIEKQIRGRLSYSGRQYKLVADVDLNGLPDRNYYEVVAHDEAKRVLAGIAVEPGTPAELLATAGQKLARDWRPPVSEPDGLILLRRTPPPRAAVSNAEPAITPSQMRAMKDKAALVIHVVDLKQKLQEGLAFKIDSPDGSTISGKLDKAGRGRAQSTTPGDFTVTFPDLDGDDWDGDGALGLSEEERSEASKYTVEQGDRLPTIARDKGFARWQTIWAFEGNAALRRLRGTAHILLPGDEVSIPSKLSREAKVPGGTAEYVVQTSAEVLRVRFAGVTSTENNPVTFKATPDTGDAIEGTLAKNAKLEVDLPPDTTKVHVELSRKADGDGSGSDGGDGDKPFASWDFTVGGLDPASEVSGVQARLLNLGFYTGSMTGTLDDDTRAAIAHFRWAKLRDRKDDMDEDFLAALNKTHGS